MKGFEKFSRRIFVISVVMQRACARLHQARGLTNDDEVGVRSTDGVSNSLVRVQLPSGRRASKFDRGFPSVDELDGSAF